MKALKSLFAAALMTLSLATGAAASDDENKLVTVVTSPDPQTQLMAMVLTMQSIKLGVQGHILLCGPAGDIALKDAPASATAPQNPKGMSPQSLMMRIMEMTGTKVEVCAIYLPNKGADASALLDGIGVAKPPAMAARLMADDTRIMSF
ncbi:MAG: hypothetical protein NXI16_06460 [Alphaproteobacteria bacterium]|nr:hypothetical protein [Alphaproteobacteria bacterium]